MKILQTFSITSTPFSFFDGQFKYLTEHGYNIHMMCSYGIGVEDFSLRNGITYKENEFTRSLTPIKDILAFYRLCAYLKKEHFDVVVGHTTKDSLLLMIGAWLCKVKHRVYFRHGLLYTTQKGFKRYILLLEEKFVSAFATKIVNVSPSLAKIAIEDKLNASNKQCLIRKGTCGGIDAKSMFNPAIINKEKREELLRKYKLEDCDLVFGFCGRFCKDKGIEELVEAFNLFKKEHREIKTKLLLIGTLDTRDNISTSLYNILNMDPTIVITGFVERKKIPYYYSLMDIFILPSHREGYPTVVLETSAMELPVLTTKAHGCIDSIEDGVTGLYIPFEPQGICSVMDQLLDINKRKEMGVNGRKRVLENYDYSVMWPEVLQMYQSLK